MMQPCEQWLAGNTRYLPLPCCTRGQGQKALDWQTGRQSRPPVGRNCSSRREPRRPLPPSQGCSRHLAQPLRTKLRKALLKRPRGHLALPRCVSLSLSAFVTEELCLLGSCFSVFGFHVFATRQGAIGSDAPSSPDRVPPPPALSKQAGGGGFKGFLLPANANAAGHEVLCAWGVGRVADAATCD